MTVVAAYRYCQGDMPVVVPIGGPPRARPPAGCFDWIGLFEPDAETMSAVAQQFGLHPLAVEDAMSANHAPKVEPFGDQLFVIARTAALSDAETIVYGQTAIFLGGDFLITVRQGSTRAHTELRRQLEAAPGRLQQGPDFVLHAVIDYLVDGYEPAIDSLEKLATEIEEQAISEFPDPGTIRRIFNLRRQLRRFERVVGPMTEVCERLAFMKLPAIDAADRPWFRDVLDHVRRSLARVGALKDLLATLVETASLLEQQRQSKTTRQLAAWAAILAVPTAIAGVYGMNFQFMPELGWRFGYPLVVGAMIAICATLYWRFRKFGWL